MKTHLQTIFRYYLKILIAKKYSKTSVIFVVFLPARPDSCTLALRRFIYLESLKFRPIYEL